MPEIDCSNCPYGDECQASDDMCLLVDSPINEYGVMYEVNKALEANFEIFSFEDMLNAMDGLSPGELAWATDNLSVCIVKGKFSENPVIFK